MKRILTAALCALVLVPAGMADPTVAANLPTVAVIKLEADPQKGLEADRGKGLRGDSANATQFRLLPGLKGPQLVSLESVGDPGAFVRHKDAVVWLHERPRKNNLLFDANASFRVIHLDGDKYRFEAAGLDGMFIAVKDDGAVILARNPPPEKSTFILTSVDGAAPKVAAAPGAVAPAALPTAPMPAVPGSGGPPSSQIEPFLEPSLNAILAPLAENPQMPRVPVEKLRATLGAGAVTAKTPQQKQIYQYGIAVCEALTQAMDERAETRAAAIASGTMPSINTGGGIVKSAPIRGWDAGHDADAIRRKENDERQYADGQARGASNFMESSAYKAWVTKAAGLRENVMGLYGKLVQLEAEAGALANEAAVAPPPAPK